MFKSIFPHDNIIRVVQKSHGHGEHYVKMSEVAAWVLSATHWYALLRQPMMFVVWCHDWIDASRFQYLMQILQVQYQDYVPKHHIFVDDAETVHVPIQTWQSQPLYGMVNQYLGSWLRRISMIYLLLVSRTSIQCGHFQLRLSINVGIR